MPSRTSSRESGETAMMTSASASSSLPCLLASLPLRWFRVQSRSWTVAIVQFI
ncbi:MAG: hypothetical protein MI923_09625 [Phycisphaerales bacterium]|nr:hypothetical protein [Phycisphaerales bacterium]